MVITGILRFVREALGGMFSTFFSDGFTTGTTFKVGLFTAWPGFNDTLVLADLTEPTFGGYAQKSTANWSIGVDSMGRYHMTADGLHWSPTNSDPSDPVIGAFLVDSTGTELVGVIPFGTLFQMTVPTDDLSLIPNVAMPNNVANWGEVPVLS